MKKNKILYLSILFFILFTINSILVKTNFYVNIDNEVHNFVIGSFSDTTTTIMKAITFLGSTVFIVGLCAAIFFYLLYKKRYKSSFSTALVLSFSMIVNVVVKHIIKRARPVYMIVKETTYSYPSGHTTGSATLYGFIIYLILKSEASKGYKILFTIILGLLVIMIGTSRIYLGAHYFSDVLGGILSSTAVILLFAHIDSKKKILD